MSKTETTEISQKIESDFQEEDKGKNTAIMMSNISLPTYKETISKMAEYVTDTSKPERIRRAVFEWEAEYSERNHNRMMIVVSKLFAIKANYHEEEFDVPEEDKKIIFDIGCDIHKEGGKTAQQACFYTVINFVEPDNKRTKAIEVLWNRAGEWRY